MHLERFQNENALAAQMRRQPQYGVDSGENDVFPQNDALKHRVFQKQNALVTAGVLGVMYLLFSGSKLTETQQAISAIRMNVQQTFTSSLDYTGLSNDYVIKAGLTPKKLIKGGSLLNSWGGSLTVATGDDTGTFTITLAGIPQEDCTKLAVYQLETWLNLEVNSTAISRDSAVVEAADACQGSNTIVYTAR